MFIDQARISVSAGAGGNGCKSFLGDRSGKIKKADGGDGGDGGDLIIESSKSIQTLLDFQYNRNFTAQRGAHGGSNNKTGKRGESFTILVPCGTIIKDDDTGLVLRDLVNHGDSVIIAKGGRGGKGNSRRRDNSPGMPGEHKRLILELKLIADVGIIGYPNAGKSTFISAVSSAKSKIADYPFTTKSPILGVVRRDDEALTFADMPGLIDGAHLGRGLGHTFLRHIERTSVLIHMVDVSGIERPDPYQDLLAIEKELELYSRELAKKKKIIVLSKIDQPDAEKNVKKIRSKIKKEVFPISSVTMKGVDDLLDHVFGLVYGKKS